MSDVNTALTFYTRGVFEIASDGTANVGYCDSNDNWVWQPWSQVWPEYHYYWCGYGYRVSKIEKAFKIVQMLMDKGIAKPETVKQFVELVNEISEVL